MSLLEVRDLSAYYGPAPVLTGVSFSVDEGQVVSVLGANGAGKTTLLRALSGLVRIRGEVLLEGDAIGGRAPHRIARAGVVHVVEGRGTFTGLTVEENLRVAAYRGDKARATRLREQVYGYFAPLARLRNRLGGALSGGEQQMLAIGRALMMAPKILLLDEPSQGLAPQVTEAIFEVLGKLNREERVTMLLVEQNAELALELATFGYVLENGRIAVSGEAAALRDREDIRRAYLGY